jgi:succinoglycan biosynthesis protein ExoM
VPKNVCIGVCTCQRPQMLGDCLKSLLGQEDILGVIVVDNDPDRSAACVAAEYPVHYRHEPRRGIPFARNAVLQAALLFKADWLIFIDDDEMASQHWTRQLLSKAVATGADVVSGPVALSYPDGYPVHLPRRTWRVRPDGPATTGNLLISLRFLRSLEPMPSFDCKLTAGEDAAFLTELIERGAVFARAPNAIVTETAVISRYSLWGNIVRGYNGGKRRTKERGKKAAITEALRLIGGPLKIAFSPVAIIAGRRAFVEVCYAGFRTTASGAGAIAGAFCAEPVFYTHIDGH